MSLQLLKKCSGGDLVTVTVSSPIGDIEISGCALGLHSVKQTAEDDSSLLPDPRKKVVMKCKADSSLSNTTSVLDTVEWLQKYFGNRIANSEIPKLCPSIVKQGSFCERALSLLPKAVPFGSTTSYKGLAELCGNAKACRAAGQAMATNPISFLIPCHRVVSSQGTPGNYSHGKKNGIKVWLLDFEKDGG